MGWTVVLLLAAAAPDRCRSVVVSGDPEYAPFAWYAGGTLRGAAIEIAGKALDRIHLPHKVAYLGPFQRVLYEARSGRVDIIVELKRNQERGEYLAFATTPVFSNPVAVFVRADSKLSTEKWDNLAGVPGGLALGQRFGGGLDEFVAAKLSVETAAGLDVNFEKLAHGRIDYFITGYYPGMAWLLREQREAQFKALKPYLTQSDNYVGWAKASPCLTRLPEFDAALAAMVKSGEVRRIVDASLDQLRPAK